MTRSSPSSLETLMEVQRLEALENRSALEWLSSLIDLSQELGRLDGTTRALAICEELENRDLAPSEYALLHYFWANAWEHKRLARLKDLASIWSWEQPELLQQLFHLRSAVACDGFENFDVIRRCQILTNLGNAMSTAGRVIEAVEYWDQALQLQPAFGMALGNRAYGLTFYARSLYDSGHAAVFLKLAHDGYTSALAPAAMYENPAYAQAREGFEHEKREIERVLDLSRIAEMLDLDSDDLGNNEEEQLYRRWCLARCLFLNPLNDLGPHTLAARDLLALPDFVVPVGEPPALTGFYSQMKQEFVSARFLAFESIHHEGPHYSDREVLLYDTLDYPAYSLSVERAKAAYRIAYSLFDKIAFFLNAYWNLGMRPRDVALRTVWYQDGQSKKGLRPEFGTYQNLALRGLFWLSNDLFDDRRGFRDTTQPDAQALSAIRNYLEHRCLRVHDGPWNATPFGSEPVNRDFARSLGRHEFEAKTIRLLKMARAALIYLSLAMHREERMRAENRSPGLVVPMPLQQWPDEWKR